MRLGSNFVSLPPERRKRGKLTCAICQLVRNIIIIPATIGVDYLVQATGLIEIKIAFTASWLRIAGEHPGYLAVRSVNIEVYTSYTTTPYRVLIHGSTTYRQSSNHIDLLYSLFPLRHVNHSLARTFDRRITLFSTNHPEG